MSEFKLLLDKCVTNKQLSFDNLASAIYSQKEFQVCTGSRQQGHHHFGDGGLQKHTLEVLEIAINNARWFNEKERWPRVDMRDVFFACLFHDYGKIWDYQKIDGDWAATEHKKRYHHVFRSALEWNSLATQHGYPLTNREEVMHAILAHHNLPEWGSPVRPRTPLALIVHNADYLSAHMDVLKNG